MPRVGFGVAYCSSNSVPYQSMQQTSAASIRRFHPDWPVAVVPLQSRADAWETIRWHFGSKIEQLLQRALRIRFGRDERHRAFAQKIAMFVDPPFEQTLFLDCDTVCLQPVGEWLERETGPVDVLIQQWVPGRFYYRPPPGEPFRFYNAGVVWFNLAFSERYKQLAKQLAAGGPVVHDPDQYLLSEAIAGYEPTRVREHSALQFINYPAAKGPSDGRTREETLRDLCRRPGDYFFLHYIFHKKSSLKAVQQAMNLS